MSTIAPPGPPEHLRRQAAPAQGVAELLDATPWGSALSWPQLVTLAPYFELYEVPADATVFAEGDSDLYLAIISSGSVRIVKELPGAGWRVLTTMGAGKTFGEMALADHEPRSAAAVTAAPTLLLVLRAEAFERFARAHPGAGVRVAMFLAKLISQRLRQTSGQLVEHL